MARCINLGLCFPPATLISTLWIFKEQPIDQIDQYKSSLLQTAFVLNDVFHSCLSPPKWASNYSTLLGAVFWWRMTGSNRRPPACKAGALPAELIPQCPLTVSSNWNLVGLVGLEPTTPALSTQCSNQLSYRPIPQHNKQVSLPIKLWLVPTTDKCGRSI